MSDLGISHKQSHNWQKLAGIPAETFDATLDAHKDAEQPITTAGVTRAALRLGVRDLGQIVSIPGHKVTRNGDVNLP